ncbi:MAG: hypothetical protein AB8G17_20630, partial [Gammaproteobacteria bacterium]
AKQTIDWVNTRARSFIDNDLREIAVEDYARYPHCAHPDGLAKVKENYEKYCGSGSITSAECAGFASRVYGHLINPKVSGDASAPSVLQVGLLPKDASCGHNVVILNTSLTGHDREISLDPLPANASNWVVVDGWRAGLGWPYDECVFPITSEYVATWGSKMQIIKGWNPTIALDFKANIKKTGHKLW